MTIKKTLPSKYKAIEKTIFKLVSTKSVSKTICIKQLKLAPNYFNAYKGTLIGL